MIKRFILTAVVLILAASLALEAGSLKLVQQVAPVYPPEAKAAGIEGVVRLNATIDEEGAVTKVEVLEGPSELRTSAETAVLQWRYEPVGAKVKTTININFAISKDKPPEQKK
jgi:TonB family protein